MVSMPRPHTEPEDNKSEPGATNPRPIDASNSAKPESAPDPFDIKRWALSQSFAEVIGVKKVLSHVPLGKPGNQDGVRVHEHPDYCGNFPVIKLKAENEKYFIKPEMVAELASEIVQMQEALGGATVTCAPVRQDFSPHLMRMVTIGDLFERLSTWIRPSSSNSSSARHFA
jgi:hypothetical protein